MRNIINFDAEKYKNKEYEQQETGIYKIGDQFVTSLSFEQEPELEGGNSPQEISQYPLEDILDKFYVYVSDFYDDLNQNSTTKCYQEFASDDIQDIKNLRTIIGKHVYNKVKDEDEEQYVELIIE